MTEGNASCIVITTKELKHIGFFRGRRNNWKKNARNLFYELKYCYGPQSLPPKILFYGLPEDPFHTPLEDLLNET